MESKFYKITNMQEIIDFAKDHERNHTYYCHYSTLQKIDCILKNECIWLSRLDEFNDTTESDNVANDKNLFGLCFSALFSENLPMWYLYGGITGTGARITFKKNSFWKWINSLEFVLVNKFDNKVIQDVIPVEKKYHDVIYASLEGQDKCRIKYNGCVNKNFLLQDYMVLKEKHKGFVKEIPWFYEKEFRILVRVDDAIAEQLNRKESEIKLAVRLREETFKTFDIMLGPESEIDDFSKYLGFTKFLRSKIQKSSFKVKMNLLYRNQRNIIDEISQWYNEFASKNICEYIHNQNHCKRVK